MYYIINNLIFHHQKTLYSDFINWLLSDDLWLKNAQDFEQSYIGIDGKYDLNIDRIPVLTIVTKNNAGFVTPVAFGTKFNNIFIYLYL